jgi:hypothetical protein
MKADVEMIDLRADTFNHYHVSQDTIDGTAFDNQDYELCHSDSIIGRVLSLDATVNKAFGKITNVVLGSITLHSRSMASATTTARIPVGNRRIHDRCCISEVPSHEISVHKERNGDVETYMLEDP